MTKKVLTYTPFCKKLNRRRFIHSCAACSACLETMPLMTMNACSERNRMRLRIIYSLHEVVQSKPDWPYVGYDFETVTLPAV